jgi:hypothetical protein
MFLKLKEMKKFKFILLIIMLFANASFSNEFLTKSKELGAVSYLTTIKALAEHQMITLASNKEYLNQPEKAANFRSNYNLLKLSIDKFINQLSVDMIEKNNVSKYKKLNKYLKGELKELPNDLLSYKLLIEEIDGQIESFLLRTYSSMLAGAEIGDIISGVELVHTAIKDARDFREKKVQSIIKVLESLKMDKVKDLTEKKEKD